MSHPNNGRWRKSGERSRYRDAAIAGRELLSAARDECAHRAPHTGRPLSGSEWKVLTSVIEQVTLWSRIEDRVATKVLAEMAGMSERQTARLLRKLEERGLGIAYIPGEYRSRPSTVVVGKAASARAKMRAFESVEGGASAPHEAGFSTEKGGAECESGSEMPDEKVAPNAEAMSATEEALLTRSSVHAHEHEPRADPEPADPNAAAPQDSKADAAAGLQAWREQLNRSERKRKRESGAA